MLKGFEDYLNSNYIKIHEINWENAFRFKNIPDSLNSFYREFSKSKKVFWTPETLAIVSYKNGANKKEIKTLKKAVKDRIKQYTGTIYSAENVPEWYYDFLTQYQNLSIVRGSIIIDNRVFYNVVTPKPKQLNGLFYIGKYSGITPNSTPIFTNEQGEIFAFAAKEFRSYPTDDSEQEAQRYLNSTVPLIGKWKNIDEFLSDETPRLEKLYIQNPSLSPVDNSAPLKLK